MTLIQLSPPTAATATADLNKLSVLWPLMWRGEEPELEEPSTKLSNNPFAERRDASAFRVF